MCIVFKNKLKFVKEKIGAWARDYSAEKNLKKQDLILAIVETEKAIEGGIGTDDMINEIFNLLKNLRDLENEDRPDAAQKAKVNWDIKADENTKIFHGLIN